MTDSRCTCILGSGEVNPECEYHAIPHCGDPECPCPPPAMVEAILESLDEEEGLL